MVVKKLSSWNLTLFNNNKKKGCYGIASKQSIPTNSRNYATRSIQCRNALCSHFPYCKYRIIFNRTRNLPHKHCEIRSRGDFNYCSHAQMHIISGRGHTPEDLVFKCTYFGIPLVWTIPVLSFPPITLPCRWNILCSTTSQDIFHWEWNWISHNSLR